MFRIIEKSYGFVLWQKEGNCSINLGIFDTREEAENERKKYIGVSLFEEF